MLTSMFTCNDRIGFAFRDKGHLSMAKTAIDGKLSGALITILSPGKVISLFSCLSESDPRLDDLKLFHQNWCEWNPFSSDFNSSFIYNDDTYCLSVIYEEDCDDESIPDETD